MNKIKYAVALILLLILTCGIIFAPQIISTKSRNTLLNKTAYRNYNAGNRARITAEDVAELYYNRKISIGYNSSSLITDYSESAAIRENAIKFIESIFIRNNGTFCDRNIKDMLLKSDEMSCYRNGSLVNIGGKPAALNFIEIVIKDYDSYLGVMYEEKTGTLLNFSYNSTMPLCDEGNEESECLKELLLDAKDYYEDKLKLKENQYYSVAVSDVESYLQFGIAQYDVSDEKEEICY